jgi:hypothetical protein
VKQKEKKQKRAEFQPFAKGDPRIRRVALGCCSILPAKFSSLSLLRVVSAAVRRKHVARDFFATLPAFWKRHGKTMGLPAAAQVPAGKRE